MQSFIQYRRSFQAVQQQYERDRSCFLPQDDPEKQSARQNSRPQSDCTLGPNYRDLHGQPNLPPQHDVRDPERNVMAGPTQTVDRDMYAENPPSSGSSTSSGSTTPRNCIQQPELSEVQTQQDSGVQLAREMTGVEVRKRKTKEGGEGAVFVVDFQGDDDPLNPHNWPYLTRWLAIVNIALIGWVVGYASSVDSGALPQASEYFGVSDVVESLATGLFLIGFGGGALVAGPISEEFGRNPVYIGTLTMYMIFIMASALAPNIGAQLAFRFLAGWFGATPLSCAGGSVGDLFNAKERVWAFPTFANAAFMGPIFGPIAGGFISQRADLGWRWCEWTTLIISGAVLILVVIFQPETYPSTLLRWRAAHLRKITGDDRYKAGVEVRTESFGHRLGRAIRRPFILLLREPIVMLFGLYLTIIYIILFTFLNGYTFIFSKTYGFSQGITGLSFLGIAIGLCLATPLIPLVYHQYNNSLAKAKEQGDDHLPPETRLRFAMYGAPAVPISMFWMGWTAYPSISYWSPLVASVLFGYGILCIFISCYQYLIDSYALFAASALGSVTLVRYVAAGAMVPVAIPMYTNLGVHWTLTIVGAISALITPVPYLFFYYGDRVRRRSKFAQG